MMEEIRSLIEFSRTIEYNPSIHSTFTDLMNKTIRRGTTKLYKKAQIHKRQGRDTTLESEEGAAGRSTAAMLVGQMIEQIMAEYIKHILTRQSEQTTYLRNFFPFLHNISSLLTILGIPSEEELRHDPIEFIFEKQVPSIGEEGSVSGKTPFSRVDALLAYEQEEEIKIFIFEIKVSTLPKEVIFKEYEQFMNPDVDGVSIVTVTPENINQLGNMTFAFVQMTYLMDELLTLTTNTHNLFVVPIVVLVGDSFTLLFLPDDPITTMSTATAFSGINNN